MPRQNNKKREMSRVTHCGAADRRIRARDTLAGLETVASYVMAFHVHAPQTGQYARALCLLA